MGLLRGSSHLFWTGEYRFAIGPRIWNREPPGCCRSATVEATVQEPGRVFLVSEGQRRGSWRFSFRAIASITDKKQESS
jgi:hypothetical protein